MTKRPIDAANALPRFDKPAVVVWAADDKIFPRAHGQRLAELLAQARFEILPRTRTFIPVEQPDLPVDAVRRFLADSAP